MNASQQTARRRTGRVGAVLAAGALALLAGSLLDDRGDPPRDRPPRDRSPEALTGPTAGIGEVRSFAGLSTDHTRERVRYAHTPPVGGEHAPSWQTCGFYDQPVPAEQAVHSLEHGAVWITYRPELPAAQVEALRRIAAADRRLLVTPFAALPAPVVASAWGHQLYAGSADDSRLHDFVRSFVGAASAPKPGGPCHGGAGTPVG